MKFTIPTQEFNKLLNRCISVIGAKTTLPILNNILLEASNGVLTLTSSDLTVTIRCCAPVHIEQEGATTLPAKKLAQLVRELTSPNLQMITSANDVTEIRADGSRFKINGMSKEHFPKLAELYDATKLTIKQGELKNALHRTSFAVSRDDTRYIFTGVCLHISNSVAKFISTDGKRLARNLLPISIDPAFTGSFVIPIKAVDEILMVLTDDDENATLLLVKDKVALQTKDSLVVSRLLDGDYPDLQQVIPQTVEKYVCLHRDELTILLKQIAPFTSENSHAVKFSFSEGELKLSANASEVGEGNVSMPVDYRGEPMDVAFNPTLFIDFLRHSRGETVSLGMTDPFNPGVITESKGTEYVSESANPLFVLMPMRLNE